MNNSGTRLDWSNRVRGLVPEEWSVGPLDGVLKKIESGRSPDLPGRPAQAGEWGVLKVSAIRPDGFRETENKAAIDSSVIDPSTEVKRGDLLISRANTPSLVGLACYVRETRPGLMLSDKTLRLNIDSALALPEFISYLLQAPSSRRQIETSGTGSSGSMKNISQGEIRSLVIPLPGIQEQLRVVEVLHAVEEAIRSTERLIAKIEQAKQGLLRSLLNHALVATSTVATLGDVSSIASGVTLGRSISGPVSVELPYLRVANVQDGFIDTSEVKRVRILRGEIERYRLSAGDVLMTEGGDFDKLGRGAVWDGSIDPCLHQNHIFRVRCIPSMLVPDFLAMYSASPAGRRYFVFISKQTTNLASINTTQLKSFPIPIPPLKEQLRIVSIAKTHDGKIAAEKELLRMLRMIKQGLMNDLLTGRVRVRP